MRPRTLPNKPFHEAREGGRRVLPGGPLCFVLAMMAAVSGCGPGEAPTSEQDRQMDEAEAMLNDAPAALGEVDDSGLSGAANDGSAAAPPP